MIATDINGFQGRFAYLNGKGKTLDASILRLAHAAMTVGRRGYREVAQQGFYRLAQLFSTIMATVRTEDGRLCIDERYYSLEKSEKDSVSYLLGMAITKLIAEDLLHVAWLKHLASSEGVTLAKAPRQAPAKVVLCASQVRGAAPDLLGFDPGGGAHVFEAKGSCSGFRLATLQHAIEQVSQVTLVNGNAPATRVACFADCSMMGIRATVIDPNAPDVGIAVDSDVNATLSSYYRPFLDRRWTGAAEMAVGDFRYRYRPIGVPSVFFAVRTDYLQTAASPAPFEGLSLLARNFDAQFTRESPLGPISAFADGTALMGDPFPETLA